MPHLLPCVLLFVGGQASTVVAQATSRAYVLDAESPALVTLDLATGKAEARLALSGRPIRLLRSPEGSRLVALDPGPGEDKDERGYKATGKSVATVIDPAAMSIVGRVELGVGVAADRSYFSPDGSRLTVLCPGYEAKNPAESQVRELVVLDVRVAKEAGRLTIEHGAVPIVPSADGRTLPMIQGLPRSEKYPFPKSRLWIVDLAGPAVAATLDNGGWANLYTDGAHFYLLDAGKPDKDPKKNRNGTVQTVSIEQRSLAGSLHAGREPRGLYQDEQGGQVFIPSDGPADSTAGELRVIRGASLAATLKVAQNPKLLKRDGDVVYVVGGSAVTLVDPGRLEVTATIPLARGNEGIVGNDDLPTDLAVTPDGKRAFILYGVHNKVAVLDLEHQRAVGSTKTGRGGKKLFGHVMGGMLGVMGGPVMGGTFSTLGYLAAGYPLWAVSGPRMLAVRPDGRFAYAINTQTKDVTVVDGTTAEAVEQIGGGGYALRLLSGGTMAVVSGSELHLLDTARNVKAAELELPGLRGLAVSTDGAHAVALAKRAVLCLDGATGTVLARLEEFADPSDVLFDSPAEPHP